MKSIGVNRTTKSTAVLIWSLIMLIAACVVLWAAPTAYAADYEDEPEEEADSATDLTIDSAEVDLSEGDEMMLTVSVEPGESTCPPLEWASSDESVAVVDEDGQVTAVSEGEAVITVTSGGMSDSCDVTVMAVQDFEIKLSSSDVTLAQHDTLAIEIEETGKIAALGGPKWSSSNDDVASVDASGKVTAISPGEAEISVAVGSTSAVCTVRVVPCEILPGSCRIDKKNSILYGVRLNTSVEAFKARLDNDAELIEVYNGKTQIKTGRVGTGMVVKLVVNKMVKDELTVSVAGDVNGDGLTSVYEYSMARMYLLGQANSDEDPALYDLNSDGSISITDYTIIRLSILGINPQDNLSGFPDLKPRISAAAKGCSASLKWDAVPGADGYEVLRSTSSAGEYETVDTVSGGTLKYTDNTLKMGRSYYYRVIAYRIVEDTRVDTQFSEEIKVTTSDYTVYYQGDSEWDFSRSVRKKACVLTAFAITINNMGTSCTPPDIYKSNGKRTSIKFDNLEKSFDVEPVCGLSSSSKYLSSFDGGYTYIKNPSSNYEAAVKEALARNPEGVILYFKKGSDAHAVVACKLDDGEIYYSDPGRNRTTLVDFSDTWWNVVHNMKYKHLAYMVALDRT